MRVLISSYEDGNADPYAAAGFHTDDLSVVFVDTAAGYTEAAGPSAWAQSILTGLGKHVDLPGSRGHASDDLNVVPVWLHAHRTRWVVLPDAHLLTTAARARVLAAIAAGGADLLLIARPHRLDQTVDAFIGWNPTVTAWDDLGSILDTYTGGLSEPTTDRAEVPSSDWPTFRWDARQTMTDEQFARFDRSYRAAYTMTRRILGPDTVRITRCRTQTRRLLDNVIEGLTTVDEMIIAVRAVQAAHFARGFNLRIHYRTMMARLVAAADARLRDGDWTALRTYQDPIRTAVCALRASGMPVTQIRTTTIAQARRLFESQEESVTAPRRLGGDDEPTRWATGTGPELRADPRARPFVAAAVLHRVLDGAADDALLVPHVASWTSKCLNRAWADTGVSIGVGYCRGHHGYVGAWQYQDGFKIQGVLG